MKCLPASSPIGIAIAAPSLPTNCFSARWTRGTMSVTRGEEVQDIREWARTRAVSAD